MTGQAFFREPFPVSAVIAIVIQDGKALLVRRANPPDAGLWGFPGRKIEFGETVAQAATRELLEETGVAGEAQGVITTLDSLTPSKDGRLLHHYILIAIRCRWTAGEPVAGDDALEARWFALTDLDPSRLPMSADVDAIARQADALNRSEALSNPR